MNDIKPWYRSMTVWGGLLAAISPLLRLVGYEINIGQVADLLATFGALLGGFMAVVGRLIATKLIGTFPRPEIRHG